jgi:hypothetical protein
MSSRAGERRALDTAGTSRDGQLGSTNSGSSAELDGVRQNLQRVERGAAVSSGPKANTVSGLIR